MLKISLKMLKNGVQNSILLGLKIWQLKNWAENDDVLPVKRILLSFPRCVYPLAIILHGVAQWTPI
jgi:hypothetical protein